MEKKISTSARSLISRSSRDTRCHAGVDIIEKALTGYYRAEHLFGLEQALALYDEYQQKVSAGHPRPYPIRQWTRVCRQSRAGVDRRGWSQDRLHRTRQSVGERLHREL